MDVSQQSGSTHEGRSGDGKVPEINHRKIHTALTVFSTLSIGLYHLIFLTSIILEK